MKLEINNEIFPWHRVLFNKIEELKSRGSLPHALALCSKEGWGEAQLLSMTCNILLGYGRHIEASTQANTNFMWVSPEGSVIKIDQIRRVIDFAYKTGQKAHYKVIAISQGHLLNMNAANALLKVVEEPPVGTVIVLQTSRWASLPATLRSRFHRFIPDLSPVSARKWLDDEGLNISDVEYSEIGYAPLHAESYQAQGFGGFLGVMRVGKVSDIVDQVLTLDCVAWLGNWYRFLLGRLAIKSEQTESLDFTKVFDFCDELVATRKEIEMSNSANKRLLLERLIVDWRNQSIDALTDPN